MTIRNAYDYILIECNKAKAPSLLLEDFVYFFNKAIQQWINLCYNKCEYNQQSSDDLGFLQTYTIINPINDSFISNNGDNIWKFILPNNYIHMLNCIAEFNITSNNNHCNINKTKIISSNCQRLTADLYGGILNNYYTKPSYKKPYYYIINNESENNDENFKEQFGKDTLIDGIGYIPVKYNKTNDSTLDTYYDLKEQFSRISNQSPLILEIHVGKSTYKLNKLYITYLKAPMYVSINQEELLAIEDTTQILEFSDYVCYEIINICLKLILENSSNPRLQTNIPINQSIATPTN